MRDNWQAAQQWLADPTAPPGDGSKAAAEIIEAGLSAAELMDSKEAQELRKICNDAKAKLARLEQLRKDGKGKLVTIIFDSFEQCCEINKKSRYPYLTLRR